MKKICIILFTLNLTNLFSVDIGAGLSIDYYNNPIEDSAPSPMQNRPIVFHNLSVGFFNLKSGVGVLFAEYEIQKETFMPVFNDYYSGFRTVELDAFVKPGLIFTLNSTLNLGVSGGVGARFPIISEIMDISREDADKSLSWFYSDIRYLFWETGVFTYVKAVKDVSFYGEISFKQFIKRENQWTIGATVGILWL